VGSPPRGVRARGGDMSAAAADPRRWRSDDALRANGGER
jgi:hypothetical protein